MPINPEKHRRNVKVTVGVVSLGCSKNTVDTELMLGILKNAGYELTASEQQADILIVNTCGFIDPAKQESIDTLFPWLRTSRPGGAGCWWPRAAWCSAMRRRCAGRCRRWMSFWA